MMRSLVRGLVLLALAALPFWMPHCGGGGSSEPVPASGTLCIKICVEHVGHPPSMPPNGDLSFVPQPCSVSTTVKQDGDPHVEPVITGATMVSYPVQGATVSQVGQSITGGVGPSGYAAVTDLEIDVGWTATGTAPNGNLTFHIDSVNWSILVTMPDWTPPPGTPQSEIDIWTEIYGEIEKHEQGHVDRFNTGMAAVRTEAVCRTVEVPPGSTPEQIEDAVYAEIDSTAAHGAMVQDTENYDAPYDPTTNPTGTNHGTENGQAAWFPD